MNKDIKKYLKDIKLLFPVFSKDEKSYFERLEKQILKENTDMTYDECVEKYGDPSEIICEYYEEIDTNIIIKKIKKQHFFKKVFILAICLIVVTFGFKSYLIYKDYRESRDSRIEYVEYEITENWKMEE